MKASIIVIAYNQEQYIEETIRSISSQKTDFEFEIIVGDDCSTDNTPKLLEQLAKEIPQLKLLLHKENLGIIGNFMSVYNQAEGEYVAETGGDDYWIDMSKLQNQVDFLEKNKEYSLCCTGYKRYYQNEGRFDEVQPETSEDISFEYLCRKNPIKATTTIYRKSLIPILDESFKAAPVEDWILWLKYAKLGKVRFLKDVTAVYRIHDKSVYSGIDLSKSLLWKFEAREYIWKHFTTETSEEFFNEENRCVKTILCSVTESKQEKVDFLNRIIDMGFSKKVGLIKLLVRIDSRLSRSILWRLFDKMKMNS